MNTLEWSNRAVQHLRRGNSSEAALILLKAVFRLRKARSTEGVLSFAPSPSDEEEDKDLSNFVANLSVTLARPTPNPAAAAAAFPSAIPFFDHAFVFATHPPSEDAHLWPQTYAFLLYNTGLALHLKGQDSATTTHSSNATTSADTTGCPLRRSRSHHHQQQESFHLALKFYSMALRALQGPLVEASVSASPCKLLLLSLWNNLGHLHCSLYNVGEALQCLEWLKILITDKESSLGLMPQEHSFFSLSVLTGTSELSLAPAA